MGISLSKRITPRQARIIIGGAICTQLLQQVLAIGGDKFVLGNPVVAGATVTATVEKEGKGPKIIVYKYKRKSGYHKKNGHRQLYTKLKIEKINA